MPRKGMRSLFFTTNPSPSRASSSTPPRSFKESMIERSILAAESLITKWDPDTSSFAKVTSLFFDSKHEAVEFIKCVNGLQKAMHLMVAENSNSHYLIRAQSMMQIAMKRLQKEFYQILSTNRAYLDPESVSTRSSRMSTRTSTSDYSDDGRTTDDDIRVVGDSISEVEQVSVTTMENLRTIAECMILSGYGQECVKIYNIIRKSIIDEGIYRLGVEQLNTKKISKMDWEVLEMKIRNWLDSLKVAVQTLFFGERILCDHVFASSESIRVSCFAEISRDGANLLFSFPELASKSRGSNPDKMFRILDMYSGISAHGPEIEAIFSFDSTSSIRSQVVNSLLKLGESVRKMLSDFETLIQKNSSKSSVPGGGIHNLTRYVMNYLSRLGDYGNVLTEIIGDMPPPAKTSLPEFYFDSSDTEESPAPALSIHIAWLILILLCKLDVNANRYKDASLSYLFLANNLHHIVTKVRRSNLKYVLGDGWISKHDAKIRQFAANYERLGWIDVYSSISKDPTAGISPEEARQCFKKFNSAFEEARKKQATWVVSDPKLRDEIRVSVARRLGPIYRRFYDTQLPRLGGERYDELLVRFSPDDFGNYLSDLFRGSDSSTTSPLPSPSPSSSPWRFLRARAQ